MIQSQNTSFSFNVACFVVPGDSVIGIGCNNGQLFGTRGILFVRLPVLRGRGHSWSRMKSKHSPMATPEYST